VVIFPVATVVSNCCYENKEQRQWTFIIIWTWIIMKRAFFQRQSIRLSLAYVMCIFVNFNVLHCTPMFSKWALQLTQPAPSEHLCLHWEWKKNIKLCNSTNRQQVIDVPQIEAYRFSHRYRPILSYYHNASHKQAGSASLSGQYTQTTLQLC